MHPDAVDAKSCGPSFRQRKRARFHVWRPGSRNRPEISAVVAFVPRELAVGVGGKRKNASTVTPRARCRWMEEKGWNGTSDGHGFLGQAMVRNPPYAGGSGQQTNFNTLPRDRCGNSAICSPSPLALLPVPNFIPHDAALVTSPVGVKSNSRRERPELLRPAFWTLRWLHWIALRRSRRLSKAFEPHGLDSKPRMISAIVGSGRCIQTNIVRITIHSPTRSKGKT